MIDNRRIIPALNRRFKIISHRLASLGGELKPDPILILGNQKSGTTAITSLLAQYLGRSATLDMPALWGHLEQILRGERQLAWFVRRYASYFNREVVKEPWLTFMAPELAHIFPQAAFVLILRDPRDNIRSQLDRLNLPGNLATNPPALDKLKTGWREVFIPELYPAAVEHYIDVLAERWKIAASVLGSLNGHLYCTVRYEDFLQDKVCFIKDLAQALGYQGRGNIQDDIHKQYQPTGKHRGVNWIDFFGTENLKRIETRCGALLKQYHYPC